jgi:hypothetical protein
LNRNKEASMYRKPIGPTAHGVIDYAFATLNTLEYRAVCVASDEPLTEDIIRVLVDECGVPSEHAKFFTREEAAAWAAASAAGPGPR